ncbi:3'-5' exonuclease [Vibrio sp. Hal054]|uniref:3'-5' exonuclease n=1 Tax=Vibrio sp. Hal054 TaxID=3035158 RepID=UPI00301E3515
METTLEFYCSKIDGFQDMSFEERRSAVEQKGLTDKQHTRTSLKEVFRMKPHKDSISHYKYPNPYGRGQVECFTIAQCTPMKALSGKPRTKAQIAATEALVKQTRLRSPANQAALLAKDMVETHCVVIDTETTDLYGAVIEIALVDATTATVLYHSLVHTDEPIAEGAFEKHGITNEDLKDAPTFDIVAKEISHIMKDKQWTAFNRDFDEACMRNSAKNVVPQWLEWLDRKAPCVMKKIAVPVFGSTNRHGTISLANTVNHCGIEFEGQAHTADADAVATAKVIQCISKQVVTE